MKDGVEEYHTGIGVLAASTAWKEDGQYSFANNANSFPLIGKMFFLQVFPYKTGFIVKNTSSIFNVEVFG